MESEKLTYGDVVCLGCMDLHGYLTGSGLVDERVRCEILDDNVDVPPCLDNAKFEVRIKYQYSLWNTKDDAHGSSVARPGHIPPKEVRPPSHAAATCHFSLRLGWPLWNVTACCCIAWRAGLQGMLHTSLHSSSPCCSRSLPPQVAPTAPDFGPQPIVMSCVSLHIVSLAHPPLPCPAPLRPVLRLCVCIAMLPISSDWYAIAWHGMAWRGMAWHGAAWHVAWRDLTRCLAAEFVRSVGSPVLYGQVVQLLHVSSHKFLTVKRTQSELEKSHLKVLRHALPTPPAPPPLLLLPLMRAMPMKYKAKAAAAAQRRQATSDAIASVTSSGKRSRITDYLETGAEAGKRDAYEALALMFAGCRIPERVAEHPLFINAVRAIRDAVTGYVPPNRRFIGGAGLRMCCDNIDRGLSGVKASWKRTGMTVASDMMTDKNGRPQANVFLVNDSGAVFKDIVDCRMETKTGGYVAIILRPVVEEIGPENVVAFCTDGGSNYAVACNQLIAEWPHIQHVPCATHVLDLFMEDVGKMPWAKNVVDPAGDISSFVRNHHWTRGYLRNPEMVGARMLQALKPAGTRFRTQYIVVSRLCELRQSLAQMLMKLPFFAMRKTDADAKRMMGRMYDTMLQLTEDVGTVVEEDEEQLSYSDKVHIRRLLKNRWDGSFACPMHVAGRILNPANQDEDIFGSDVECTKVFKAFITQHAEHLCNHGKEGDDGDDFGEVLLELQERVRAFLDMKGSFGMGDAIAQRSLVKEGKYDMVKWWQWHGTDAPKLAALAIKTLSQAVSASPCERGWSTWDGVHTARRNRLGSAKCRDLVFVAHNWNVVRNWHSRADVMPGVVLVNMPEPPMPEGYNVVEGDEEEEEGDDVILEDEYE
ncbi:unnamed protein product [Closterium sp. NIES-53]